MAHQCTTEHNRNGMLFSLTISINVVVTGVTLSVVVGVFLVNVGHIGTVVARISKRVCVWVLLVLIRHQPTVILQKGSIHFTINQLHYVPIRVMLLVANVFVFTTKQLLQHHYSYLGSSETLPYLHVLYAIAISILIALITYTIIIRILLPWVRCVNTIILCRKDEIQTHTHKAVMKMMNKQDWCCKIYPSSWEHASNYCLLQKRTDYFFAGMRLDQMKQPLGKNTSQNFHKTMSLATGIITIFHFLVPISYVKSKFKKIF